MREVCLAFALVLAACGGRPLQLGTDGSPAPALDGTVVTADHGTIVTPDRGIPADAMVLVLTDKTAYTAFGPVKATVIGKGGKSFFVAGCSAFNWERLESGVWKGHGTMVDCFWDGNAVEVPAHGQHTETLHAMGGTWRLVVPYGVGCAPNTPLHAASCATMGSAVSAPFTVTPDRKSCEALEKQYQTTLPRAQACNPMLSVPQCTTKVEGGITCSCPTLVNDATELLKILAEWKHAGCDTLTWPPCGIKCGNPSKAVCAQAESPAQGSCSPVW